MLLYALVVKDLLELHHSIPLALSYSINPASHILRNTPAHCHS
jgi:hypothetical protein